MSDYSMNKSFNSSASLKSRSLTDKKNLETFQRVLKEFSPNIVEFSGDTFEPSNYNPRSQMLKKNNVNPKIAISKTNTNSLMENSKVNEKSYLTNRPLYLDFNGNYGSDGEVITGKKEHNNGKTREEKKHYGKTISSAESSKTSSPSPSPLPGTVYST